MAYLFDTNVLLRLIHREDSQHELVRAAARILKLHGEHIFFTSQNLGEFWNVSTRPAGVRSGWGKSPAETDKLARIIERIATLLPDNPAIHTEWRQLLVQHSIQGVQVHDARIVAAMKVYGISHILTLNEKDFVRYHGIKAIHPRDVN